MRPCHTCGNLTRTTTKGRCPTCHRTYKAAMYSPTYRRAAAALRDQPTHCWLCGTYLPPGVGTADHITAGDPTSPLQPACGTCNYSRGNRAP